MTNDPQTPPPILPYATPQLPELHCGWGIASTVLTAIMFPLMTILEEVTSFNNPWLNPYKCETILCYSSLLGVFLAVKGYRQPNRKRLFAHSGLILGIIFFFEPILFKIM
jgi:hypothetical protein